MKNILFFLIPKVDIAFIHDEFSVRQALEVMEYHKYSSVPILNRAGRYVGSITEGDLLWGIKKQKNLCIKDAENMSVMKIERRLDYQCVTAKSNMEDLIERAMEQNFVPVVDDQQNFIGIITRKDIISYCYQKTRNQLHD